MFCNSVAENSVDKSRAEKHPGLRNEERSALMGGVNMKYYDNLHKRN